MHFRNYGLRKTCLDQYLKSRNPEYPSKSTIVNGPKYC